MFPVQRPGPSATIHHIRTRVSHLVRPVTVRDDLVGWVLSGRKRLSSALGDLRFETGQVFVVARNTQWDIHNDAALRGDYEARLIAFSTQTVERFHECFGQFAAVPPVQGSASTLQRRLGEEGESVSASVREVRLQVAMSLLQGTGLQVSEIALRCGYDSHSRFTAAFRQRFGYPPSHLR
jgi:hypothetical protein